MAVESVGLAFYREGEVMSPAAITTSRTRNAFPVIISGLFLAGALGNFLAYRKQAESVDFLSRQAIAEIRRFWETGEGEDPQIAWQQRFWEIFKTTDDPGERSRAGLLALSMLFNLQEWEGFKESLSSLDRHDPVFERSLAMAKTAYLEGTGGQSAYISFLSEIIRDEPNHRIAATAALQLARLFLEGGRHDAASAVLSRLDVEAHEDDAELIRWWKAALFEADWLRPGVAMPPLNVPTVTGVGVSDSDLLGAPVIVLCWSPDCLPSSRLFEALYWAPPPQVQVIAVSKKKPTEFLRRIQWRERPGFYTVVDRELPDNWNCYATPTAFIFDHWQRLAGKAYGDSDLLTQIEPLIN